MKNYTIIASNRSLLNVSDVNFIIWITWTETFKLKIQRTQTGGFVTFFKRAAINYAKGGFALGNFLV